MIMSFKTVPKMNNFICIWSIKKYLSYSLLLVLCAQVTLWCFKSVCFKPEADVDDCFSRPDRPILHEKRAFICFTKTNLSSSRCVWKTMATARPCLWRQSAVSQETFTLPLFFTICTLICLVQGSSDVFDKHLNMSVHNFANLQRIEERHHLDGSQEEGSPVFCRMQGPVAWWKSGYISQRRDTQPSAEHCIVVTWRQDGNFAWADNAMPGALNHRYSRIIQCCGTAWLVWRAIWEVSHSASQNCRMQLCYL